MLVHVSSVPNGYFTHTIYKPDNLRGSIAQANLHVTKGQPISFADGVAWGKNRPDSKNL